MKAKPTLLNLAKLEKIMAQTEHLPLISFQELVTDIATTILMIN
jgi:hypothetical protein